MKGLGGIFQAEEDNSMLEQSMDKYETETVVEAYEHP